ncbi:hypothetical protein ATCC90586_004380 [Pythium insidiosum]|nr:hypothetical protein ATCC90586_004380 [Pythium insidiosum]
MLAAPSTIDAADIAALSGPSMAPHNAATPAAVLRIEREVENIGERVPMSKKRVTWRFIFADSEQVHTVMLEHSRISAKKRLRLDGRRLFTSDQYCAGDWRYEFQVSESRATRFCVAIKDVKSSVVEERSLGGVYQLFVDGQPWESLPERKLPARGRNGSSVWSSELYARRVTYDERVLTRDDSSGNNGITAQCVAWTFAFGLHGAIHKLELRDILRGDDTGEFVVILDARLLVRVNHDDIDEDVWEYVYSLSKQHELRIVVALEDKGKSYDLLVDGCPWEHLGETDFVLQPGWFPVYSRTRGTSYFRNEERNLSQWDRPIISRSGADIVIPRRLSKQHVPPPSDRFDDDGIRLSSGVDNQAHEYQNLSFEMPQDATTAQHQEVNLLDFSKMEVHASPTAKLQASMASMDPFAQLASTPGHGARVSEQQQPKQQPPPIDFLS